MQAHRTEADVPYLDGAYRWWHLSDPSPELLAAEASGWLGQPGRVVDVGCGLGSEAAYLRSCGWHAVGIDHSGPALRLASQAAPGLSLLRADARQLPFPAAAFDLAIDRGCYHYLSVEDRAHYAAEVRRVLRPEGRMLLRACMRSAGVRNDVDEAMVRQSFTGWVIESVKRADIPSDTRTMPALVVRLRHG
jgi:SAM-dependent methyltransferase